MRELPRRAVGQPRVGLLDLRAVDEGLPEDAVLVADAVADGRDPHGRQRVDEAGGQPAEAAVAQARLDLGVAQGVQVDPETRHRLLGGLGQAGGQQGVVQLPAEQVLRRQVGHHLGLGLHLRAQRLQPAGHQLLADGAGQRVVEVVLGRAGQGDPLAELQPLEELLGELLDVVEVGLNDGGAGGFGHSRIVARRDHG